MARTGRTPGNAPETPAGRWRADTAASRAGQAVSRQWRQARWSLFPDSTLVVGVWVFLGLAGNAWSIVAIWGLLLSLMPTEDVEHSSGLFSTLTNLVGAGAPALIG
jgi:hypothetical protein